MNEPLMTQPPVTQPPVKQPPMKRPPMTLYRVLRWTMSFYFRARMKIRFEGEENVPKKGPFFLVLSHQK